MAHLCPLAGLAVVQLVIGKPKKSPMMPTNETTEIAKIAFGLAELLNQQFPHLKFIVLPSRMYEVDLPPLSDTEFSDGAAIMSEKYQITITDKRIGLTIVSDDVIRMGGVVEEVGMEFLASMDKSTKRHVFELPDPEAIDKVVEIIRSDL